MTEAVATSVEAYALRLRDALTPEEKVGCLSGDRSVLESMRQLRRKDAPLVAGVVPRLGIPGIRFTDGPRGVTLNRSTVFPVAMARGASFDPSLEERIGEACGVEARAHGANLLAAPCVNLLRHPAWGRAQETYGEDSHLLGEMGAAFIRGAQRHVMACVKHFACNSMENSRFWVDVRIDEADLREIYLPHFRRCVEEGVAAVMSAYNKVNGSWCGGHRHLLTEILKQEWGFDGFVMSDFYLGVRGSGAAAFTAGQDLEMPAAWRFRSLCSLLRRGRLDMARVDDAVLRLLRQQVRFAQRGGHRRYTPQAVAGPAHRAVAREAARAGMVLLRNEHGALPFEAGSLRSLAVIGALAAIPNIGDLGSSMVRAPEVVTILDGLFAAGERHGVTIRYGDGADAVRAARTATACDAAVVVAGTTWRDEGEWVVRVGGDRGRLGLREADRRLIEAVAAANPRTVVVLMGGSAFVAEDWQERVSALLMAWYSGMEGGHAVAEVLFGEAPPGGRLPCTWPRSVADLPRFRRFARRVTYGPLHGYRLAEAGGRPSAFPFGFGLGYTRMELGPPRVLDVSIDGERRLARLAVDVTNVGGERNGVEVVQAYVPEILGTEPRRLRTLRAFAKTALAPGAQTTVELAVQLPAGVSTIWVGTSSALADLTAVPLPGLERQTPTVR